MRTLVRAALVADAQLQALGIASGAHVLTGNVDTPQERPFINLKWTQDRLALPKTAMVRQLFNLWVHDRPNDYSRVVAILRRARVVIESIEGVRWEETSPWDTNNPSAVSSSGYIIEIRRETGSDDLVDEGHGTITRYDTYSIVGS